MRATHSQLAGALVVAVLMALLGGCSMIGHKAAPSGEMSVQTAPAPSSPRMMAHDTADSDGYAAEAATGDAVGGGGEQAAASVDSAAAGITRRIIKTGEMTVEVDRLPDAVAKARAVADKAGGYVADVHAYEDTEGRRSGTITVRVPAESFDDVFVALQAIGRALTYSESAQDVTEEWVDLEARIANKKAEEASLLELLKRKGELSDILEIQRETFRVRGEIEQLEGRLRYLKNQVSLSTISVSLTEPGLAALAEPGPWRIGFHLRTAWHTLTRIIEGLVYFVIYVVVAGSVVWLPIAVLIRRARRRRAATRQAAAEAQLNDKPDGDA